MKKSKSGKGGGSKLVPIKIDKELSEEEAEDLLKTLKTRFEDNMARHEGIEWDKVEAKLETNTEKLASLNAMENTGGEPDIIAYDEETDEYIFYDCSPESPDGRRSICYDRAGEDKRLKKGIYPAGNALELAEAIGIEILDEDQYRRLQELGEFDTKTSSWIKTGRPC